MTQEIRLKAKYRIGGTSRYKSPGGSSGTRKQRRRKAKNAEPQRPKTMVIGPSGKRRMAWIDS